MPVLPMFPLGSVLLPHMPLPLRVFEPRYLSLLDAVLQQPTAEFGVVLIERGQEVGGGEHRFDHGTVAEITQVAADGETITLLAVGRRRFEVLRWLADDPYPQAEVRELPDLVWQDEATGTRDHAERLVRRTLAVASEFDEDVWPASVELSEDQVVSSWQLAGIAPLGPLDHLRLLRAVDVSSLLAGVVEETELAALRFSPGPP